MRLFLFIVIILLTHLGYPQFTKERMRNPFLTQEEEMEELGITPPPEKVKEIPTPEELKLTGILYGERKIAIINSRFYTEGDKIGALEIKEIKPLSVILVANGKEFELKLKHVLAVSEKEEEHQEERNNQMK